MQPPPPPTAPCGASPIDRRLHDRRPAPPLYLLANGAPSRLVDWSLVGLGVRLESWDIVITQDMPVLLDVLRRDGRTWARLTGTARWIDPDDRFLGVALDDGEETTAVLMELLMQRLTQVTLP